VLRGTLPDDQPSNIDMGMLLRRRMILLQLHRCLTCVVKQKHSARILVLGCGRDDQFIRLTQNPQLWVTCVDMAEVIQMLKHSYPDIVNNTRVKLLAKNIIESLDEILKELSLCDIIVAEGVFIYLPVYVITKILENVQETGKLIIFNMETVKLKDYLPIMLSGYEEISRGKLSKISEIPITTWAEESGFGRASSGIQVWLCTWCSSLCTEVYQPREIK